MSNNNNVVNAKLFAIKYQLFNYLKDSLERDKTKIKNGAKITCNTHDAHCKIKIIDSSRSSYSKDDQRKLDEYAESIGIKKNTTYFKKVEVSSISDEINMKVNKTFITLLEDADDADIKKVASKVVNRIK